MAGRNVTLRSRPKSARRMPAAQSQRSARQSVHMSAMSNRATCTSASPLRRHGGPSMAKALFGHLGPVPVQSAELARLRRRVRDLEDEVDRLSAANSALTTLVTEDRLDLDAAHDVRVADPVLT